MNEAEKERLIKKDIASIENRVRSAFNQGYEMGLKENKEQGGDAISRKAVLDLAEWFDINPQHFIVANLIDEVENMPSVSPQQRTGQWVKEREGGIYSWRCSNCESHHRFLYDYCPSCGAKMQEVEE